MNTNHITTDAPGAKDGPIARITPEADEQTDAKGRKLTTIDAEIIAETNRILAAINALRSANGARFDHIEQWMRDDARPEFDAIDKRADAIAGRVEYVCGRLIDVEAKIDRLIAASVTKPCEPSKATGENELATDIMCADRQRFLASVCDSCRAVVRAMLSKGDIPGVVNTKHV